MDNDQLRSRCYDLNVQYLAEDSAFDSVRDALRNRLCDDLLGANLF